MNEYKIAVIPGDGIGPEVVNEGIKVLKKVESLDKTFKLNFDYFPWGCEYYLKNKQMMPEDGLDILKKYDAIYLGAIGYPTVPDYISLRELLLKIRVGFDEYINLRPVKLLKGVKSPLANKTNEDIDFVVVRENSEGEYSGLGEWVNKDKEDEFVYQTGKFTYQGIKRCIKYAFELALKRKVKKVTSITKSNALNYSMVLWDKVFDEVKLDYPEVETEKLMVDAASMMFVTNPERFSVVVASNLFGDILTDLGAAIAGGIGLASGDNINPEKKFPSMFESIHGSAPNIALKNIANPIAQIWAGANMLGFLGYPKWNERIIKAIEEVLVRGKVKTKDLGGDGSTTDMGDAICSMLDEFCKK